MNLILAALGGAVAALVLVQWAQWRRARQAPRPMDPERREQLHRVLHHKER